MIEKWLPVGVLVLLPLFWCFVSFLLAHGGWSAMAARFRTAERPQGKVFRMQSGRIGAIDYRSCLTVHVSEAGMFLAVFPLFRLGNPPMFIPWSEFHNVREKKLLFWRFVEAPIGTPPIARLLLRPGVIPVHIFEACGPPRGRENGG